MSMFGYTEPLALPEERCECASCGWTGTGANLRPMEDLCVRIDAGEIVPAGECPECGALCHVVNDDSRRRDAADAALIFVASIAATDPAFAAAARAAGALVPLDPHANLTSSCPSMGTVTGNAVPVVITQFGSLGDEPTD